MLGLLLEVCRIFFSIVFISELLAVLYSGVGAITYLPILTLSVVAIEQMGGPEIPWRAGRKDAPVPTASTATLPNGRLPNADMGCPSATNSHVRDIFGRMGFNDRYPDAQWLSFC